MAGLIVGMDGFNQLMLGREININQIETKAYTVETPTSGVTKVYPGDLLRTTTVHAVYTPVTAALAANTYIAGIALATNVKLDKTFPQSEAEVSFDSGEQGAVLLKGEIAVKLYGPAPVEGAPVYYDFTNKGYTSTATSNVSVPNAKFTGRSENGLTVVRLLGL